MDDITIQLHLAFPTLLSFVVLSVILYYRQRLFSKHKWFWIGLTIFLTLYLFIVGNALYTDIYYQWDLNRYDLDKDGTFGGEEITEGQKLAMQRLTSDVGRNFSFISGFTFSFWIALAVYISGTLTSWLSK